jgi:hypothetical protein
MAVLSLMNELKTILDASENKLENLKSVAHQLASFYKTNPISAPENLSPNDIFDELCLLPNDPDYTPQTRLVKLHELRQKLLSIISSIIESEKSKKVTRDKTQRNFLIKVRENSLEIIFQVFDFIKIHIIGIGKKGSFIAFIFALIVLGLIVLYVIKGINQRPGEEAGDYRVIAETLIRDYENKKLFYKQKRDSLYNIINRGLTGTIERKRATLKEFRTVDNKVDVLIAGILRDLEFIKNNEIDSSRRSKLDSYKQNLQNF